MLVISETSTGVCVCPPVGVDPPVGVSFVGYLALLFFTHLVDNANSLLPFWALAGAVVGERLVDEDGGTERSPAVTSDQ